MLRALLQISGIEQRLLALKSAVETRAEDLMRQGQSLALQLAIAAALAIGAVTFLLLAFIGALAALYLWLAPKMGDVSAMGVVVGLLLILAVALATTAAVVGRRDIPRAQRAPVAPPASASVHNETPQSAAAGVTPAPPLVPDPVPEPHLRISSADADALLTLSRRFIRVPQTGVAPLDELLTTLTPKTEEAARDAIVRAATLVRNGDRTTMFTILGSAVAAGWLLTKGPHPGRNA